MPEGVLKKVVKTKDEKQRDLQEVSLSSFTLHWYLILFV